MIVRIVKMTFEPARIEDFLERFEKIKLDIRHFKGCERLELLRDVTLPHVFFTYSFWSSEEALNAYRGSELFGTTWKFTKSLFAAKPEAWSVNQEVILT